MHRHTLAPITTAQCLLATERDQLDAERDAFETFADRVRSVDVRRSPASEAPDALSVAVAPDGDRAGTATLRRAYRETVMGLDHYEAVYGESLTANVRGELGPDVAARLDGEGPVTPPFVHALLECVRQAVEKRASLLDHLDREGASLADARATLAEVAAATGRSDDAAGTDARSLCDRVESTVRARQSVIQDRHISPFVDGHDLCHYLYEGSAGDWTYPVLTVATTLRRDLDALSRRERPTG
jgi:hypothetical protein